MKLSEGILVLVLLITFNGILHSAAAKTDKGVVSNNENKAISSDPAIPSQNIELLFQPPIQNRQPSQLPNLNRVYAYSYPVKPPTQNRQPAQLPNRNSEYANREPERPGNENREAINPAGLLPGNEEPKQWCIAKPSVPDSQLQDNINYCCGPGEGVNCKIVQIGGACYDPNNLVSHASVLMNLYFQAQGRQPHACDFRNTGIIIVQDPSVGQCIYTAP